jgi:excinuclease ABC subunit C
MRDELREQVITLPDAPGIYRFYNSDGILIYVGKAKSLKKRAGSYFVKSHDSRKTSKLVSEIAKIEYTIANSEFDALLLENNFIKQNQPKYNILLKDDKTFPYICILKERFPRIIYTRKYIPDNGEYFGPYSSVVSMKNVLELIRQLYSIRTCNLLLSPENINQKKFKVCLEFHIGNCKGPCEGLQEEASYLEEISLARTILKGQVSIVENHFRQQMLNASQSLQYERAGFFKNKIDLLEKFQTKSLVVNPKMTDIDVISIVSNEQEAFVNYFQLKEGGIVFSKNLEIKKKLEETDEDLLSFAFQELRSTARFNNSVVLSNIPLSIKPEEIENLVPQIGDKKHLVSLSLKNALYIKSKKEVEKEEKKSKKNQVLEILQKDLRLQQLPEIIECFDNSNFQGTSPVASMVRFVDGKADKAGYRHFNIKTVEGPDDFASMKEIVTRRYKRLIDESKPLPSLIIVDGGKGQLSSACEALRELELYGRIPIVGIAKKLEEIYYPEDSFPLHISKKSPGLLLIQKIRDEAHRFAITFHRLKRSKATFTTEMESINGIGKKTADLLLSKYKSWKKIKEVPPEELIQLIGEKKTRKIFEQQKREP